MMFERTMIGTKVDITGVVKGLWTQNTTAGVHEGGGVRTTRLVCRLDVGEIDQAIDVSLSCGQEPHNTYLAGLAGSIHRDAPCTAIYLFRSELGTPSGGTRQDDLFDSGVSRDRE